jgi:hypothetical protein
VAPDRGLNQEDDMATHRIEIPNWRPAMLNEFMDRSWHVRSKCKKIDREMVFGYVSRCNVPPPSGRRKVSLRIVLGKRQQPGDVDAHWKSLLDALKQAGAIKDDSREWATFDSEIDFARSWDGSCSTTIILEDVGPVEKIRKLKRNEVA